MARVGALVVRFSFLLVVTLLAFPVHGRVAPVHAADLTVDSNADAVDANPGDGVCDDGAGNCTLRAAVQESNALPGADAINLPADTYALTIPGTGEDAAADGDLDITGDLTVSGAGQGTTVIDANGGVTGERALDVDPGSAGITVEITGVTVQNGSDSSGEGGGGVLSRGTLTMTSVALSDNTSTQDGGAVMNLGDVTLSDATVTGNSADSGIVDSQGTLTISDSTISGNTATAAGGGVRNQGGTATLTNVSVTDNTAGVSGGFLNADADATLTGVTITGNTAGTDAGGIFNSGALTLDDSTVSDNVAGNEGGGVFSSGTLTLANASVSGNTAEKGGGIANAAGTLTLVGVTVSGNTATHYYDPDHPYAVDGGGGVLNRGTLILTNVALSANKSTRDGGGIHNEGTLVATDTTISGNRAKHGGGGGISNEGILKLATSTVNDNTAVGSWGGGINNTGKGSEAVLTNVTISGNTGGCGGAIQNRGGTVTLTNGTVANNTGIACLAAIGASGAVTLKNTIVANNVRQNCSVGAEITSEGHNLDSDHTCILTGSTSIPNSPEPARHADARSDDFSLIDAKLGPLADNGGPTLTHALLAGSPAIDAGDNASCPATDQRGVARPVDGDQNGTAICDIGAYEASEGTTAPTPTPTPTPTPGELPITGGQPASGDAERTLAIALLSVVVALAAVGGAVVAARQRR